MIAGIGYAKASFSQIAEHAGLSSTGMISYHFAGKDDLIAAWVAEIERVTDAFMQAGIAAASGHVAVLRTYVEANVALVGEHLTAVFTLSVLALSVVLGLLSDDPRTLAIREG